MHLRYDVMQWPMITVLVSHRHRVMYTPIAKNANTTYKRLFVELSGHPSSEVLLDGDVHVNLLAQPTGLVLADYTPEHAAAILGNANYFHFTLLRNPLERAVSGYLDKFVRSPVRKNPNNRNHLVIQDALDWVYEHRGEPVDHERLITFREFVDYLEQVPDTALDTHFKAQSAYLVHQNIDFISTTENQQPLLAELEQRFGRHIEVEHFNRTAGPQHGEYGNDAADLLPARIRAKRGLPKPSELLVPDLAERLRKRFARDFELWSEAKAKGTG
ncbi:sulfotransferase family 2 domain-containing protein [Elongatibacter sediminis]|uniref:Sulfotransferase family 2 domain-containing protein n=1 Tax=Elongatibacter sediminis TaxID=3119006 RepID=A0AAW9RD90_9GAMM